MTRASGDPRLNPHAMTFRLETRRYLEEEEGSLEAVTQPWLLTASHLTPDDTTVQLGWGALRIFRIWEIGWDQKILCNLTDQEGSDIMDLFSRNWMDKVQDPSELGPNNLLVLERIFVEKQFRGHGLGPLIGAMAINGLRSSDTSYAVCFPSPFERFPKKTKKQAIASLNRTWAKLGFEHLHDGVWGLNLQMATFDDAFNRIVSDILQNLPAVWEDEEAHPEA